MPYKKLLYGIKLLHKLFSIKTGLLQINELFLFFKTFCRSHNSVSVSAQYNKKNLGFATMVSSKQQHRINNLAYSQRAGGPVSTYRPSEQRCWSPHSPHSSPHHHYHPHHHCSPTSHPNKQRFLKIYFKMYSLWIRNTGNCEKLLHLPPYATS